MNYTSIPRGTIRGRELVNNTSPLPCLHLGDHKWSYSSAYPSLVTDEEIRYAIIYSYLWSGSYGIHIYRISAPADSTVVEEWVSLGQGADLEIRWPCLIDQRVISSIQWTVQIIYLHWRHHVNRAVHIVLLVGLRYDGMGANYYQYTILPESSLQKRHKNYYSSRDVLSF